MKPRLHRERNARPGSRARFPRALSGGLRRGPRGVSSFSRSFIHFTKLYGSPATRLVVLLCPWWSYYVPANPTMCPAVLLCAGRSCCVPGNPMCMVVLLRVWQSYCVPGGPTTCLVVLLHAWRSSKPRGLPSWSLVPSGGHQRQSNPHGRHAGCCAVTGMCHGW